MANIREAYLQRLGLLGAAEGTTSSTTTRDDQSDSSNSSGPEVDAFRGKFLQKLAYNKVLVPRVQRPPKHQTVIIFDWDDTLLCTDFLNHLQDRELTKEENGQLRKIAACAKTMLEEALVAGHTYIITNAMNGWVEYSAAKWIPELLPTLRKVRIISAREKFEAEYPNDVDQWKVNAFLEVQRSLEYTPITNLVSLGDADFEMNATHVMGSHFDEALVKTIKFRPQPSCQEHLMEMQLVAGKFEHILQSAKSLKVSLERKTKPPQ